MYRDFINDPHYNQLLKIRLKGEIDSLTDNEKIVLILHFGLSKEGYKTMKEITKIMKLSKEEVRELECSALSKIEPIDYPIAEDVYSENERLKIMLRPKINKLPQDQKIVISLHFGLDDNRPKTISEISKILHLTSSEVKQLEIEALRNLRK